MTGPYEEWIAEYESRHKSVRGMCQSATQEMAATFPELKRVRGHLKHLGPHWWCVAVNGAIVDPTVSQYPYIPDGSQYEEFDESLAETLPTGKCMNCGGHLYYRADFCNESCHRAVLEDYEQDASGPISARYNPSDKPMYYED
jgi:hypothetical protein